MHVCGFVGNHYVTGRDGRYHQTQIFILLQSHAILILRVKKCPIPLPLTKSYQFTLYNNYFTGGVWAFWRHSEDDEPVEAAGVEPCPCRCWQPPAEEQWCPGPPSSSSRDYSQWGPRLSHPLLLCGADSAHCQPGPTLPHQPITSQQGEEIKRGIIWMSNLL